MTKQKINVNGIAVRAGTSRNGITYTAQELSKAAHGLADVPILKDHVAKTDNVIGRTTGAHFNEENESVHFSAFISDEGVTEKIREGLIKHVSIGANGTVYKESADSDQVFVKNIEFMELSTTPTPGVVGTSITLEQTKPKTKEEAPMVKEKTEPTEPAISQEAHNALQEELEAARKALEEQKEKLAAIEQAEKQAIVEEIKKKGEFTEEFLNTMTKEQLKELNKSIKVKEETPAETRSEIVQEENKQMEGYHITKDEHGVTEVWKEMPKPDITKLPVGGN
jgi:Tfp pilus tip-associated adhesin PilY1